MINQTANQTPNNEAQVIYKAFNNSCKQLGISRELAGQIVGVDKATLSRNKETGFDPKSKTGELCLHLVRLYRSLFAIAGGDVAFMKHWLNTNNKTLSAKPIELITSVMGLIQVNVYLDAMRGKV